MTDRMTTTNTFEAADYNRLLAIYDEWKTYFPWDVPALTPYREAVERDREQAARDFQDIINRSLADVDETNPDIVDVDDFGYWLTSRTRLILQNANERITESNQAEQGATLAALLEAKRDHRTDFEEVCDQTDDPCILQGLRADFDLIRAWVADNIEYLESMGVQPRRAGVVEVKQADNKPQPTQSEQQGKRDKYTAQICCVVCFLDLYADGAEVGKLPKKTALVEELAANYPQITQKLDSVRKEGSHHDRKLPKDMFNELCRLVEEAKGGRIIADWKEAVTARSKHPEKTIKYIENEILIKRE